MHKIRLLLQTFQFFLHNIGGFAYETENEFQFFSSAALIASGTPKPAAPSKNAF